MSRFPLLLPLLLLSLAGCKLVDQRTFDATAGRPILPAPPPGPAAPQALVAIDFSRPDPVYADALRQAVDAAVAAKPTVRFEVVTVVPASGTPAEQVAAATAVTADARTVARTISAQGVDDDRVTLSARTDPAAKTRRVEVFVK